MEELKKTTEAEKEVSCGQSESEQVEASQTQQIPSGEPDAGPDRESAQQQVNQETCSIPEKPAPEKNAREKKHIWKFFAGIIVGLLAALLIIVLQKGYFILPFPGIGQLTVKLPTYGLFRSDDQGIDEAELKRKLQEIDYYMENEYYYDKKTEDMEDSIVSGVFYNYTAEDGYSDYYSKKEYQEELEGWKGSFVGIGVYVVTDDETGGVKVVKPIKGGPAMEAGIKPNDIIIEANGTNLIGMDLETATGDYIKGAEGTSVDLVIMRDGERLEMTVERRTVINETVYSSIFESDGKKYGYVYISEFLGSTYNSFVEAVDGFCLNEADGIVIDLRSNPGGDMNVCLNMTDYLLPDTLGLFSREEKTLSDQGKTKLLTIRMKFGNEECYFAQDTHAVKIPISVLVDENSASASEIFAGIMKSYGYGVAGMTTYGKGIVQTVRMLYDMSGIKYTSGEYILPDGEKIHGIGLVPTVTVEPCEYLTENGADPENPDPEKDNMLAEALRLLGE